MRIGSKQLLRKLLSYPALSNPKADNVLQYLPKCYCKSMKWLFRILKAVLSCYCLLLQHLHSDYDVDLLFLGYVQVYFLLQYQIEVSGSKCVHPTSVWQNWKLCFYCSPSQSLQESACTFKILPLISPCQSLPLTLSHPFFWNPEHFVRCLLSVYVIAKKERQQKLDDKIDTCEHSLAGISYAFCNVKVEISLESCWEVGTFMTMRCSSWTTFLRRARITLVDFVPRFSQVTLSLRSMGVIFNKKFFTD